MNIFSGIGGFLIQHPVIGLIVFLAVSAGVLFVLSGGKLVKALLGIGRVLLTIITTPFVFMRDALAIIMGASEEERDYQRTRVFMLFRYSRIQYLTLLIAALLMLSGGITTSLLSLYPQMEMEQSRQLGEYIDQLEEQIDAAEGELAATGSPEHRQTLQTQRDTTRQAYETQRQSNAAYIQSGTYSSPLLSQILSARSKEAIAQVTANTEAYMADCPRGYGWQGFSVEDCTNLRNFAAELAERRTREFTLAEAAQTAEEAWQQTGVAGEQAAARLEGLQQSRETARQQRGSISLFNPSVIGSKLSGAIGILISTVFGVIALIWFGALLIDFVNWIILLMRSAEIENAAKVANARGAPPAV